MISSGAKGVILCNRPRTVVDTAPCGGLPISEAPVTCGELVQHHGVLDPMRLLIEHSDNTRPRRASAFVVKGA